MRTQQEVLNKVWDYFITQDHAFARYQDEDGRIKCYYYHPEHNQRCAIGCLIPDEKLMDEEFADMMWANNFDGIYGLSMRGTEGLPGFFEAIQIDPNDTSMIGFLGQIQDIHDDAASKEAFRDGLRAIAMDYDLQVPV